MYNSSKRKQPSWLILAVIIIVLGGFVVWLMHQRHLKQEALAGHAQKTQTAQVVSTAKSEAAVPVPVQKEDEAPQDSQAKTASASNAGNAASAASSAPADADDAQQTIKALQAQVVSLQQELSQAQSQLQSGSGHSDASAKRNERALKQAKKDVAYLKTLVKQLKGKVGNLRQLSDQTQGYIAKLQVENEKLRDLLTSNGIAVPSDLESDAQAKAAAEAQNAQNAASAAADEVASQAQSQDDQQAQGDQGAQDQASNDQNAEGQDGDAGSVPVVPIVDAGSADNAQAAADAQNGQAAEQAAPAQEVPEHALPALITTNSGQVDYRIDIANLDKKVPTGTPVRARYILQYQLVTGRNVFKVIGRSNSTAQSVTRLQGQFSYPENATPVKLRVEVTGPKGVIYDATYPVHH